MQYKSWKRVIVTLLISSLLLGGCQSLATRTGKTDADIIIIGAGGAGLSSAIEAVQNGAKKVIILEMTSRTGGALNYTSGSMSAAGTIIQQEDGIEDSVESYVADIINTGNDFGGQPNETLIRVYAERAAGVFDWLYENGLKDNVYTTDRATGARAVFAPEHALYSVPRTYKALPDNQEKYKSCAHEVLDALVAGYEEIEIIFNTKATELVANKQGQVLEVLAEGPEGKVSYRAKKGIIVCTGGYSANEKLMAEYVPNGEWYLAGGAAGSDGNALPMMQRVGAALTAMDAIPTFPMGLVSKTDSGSGSIAATYTWKAGGIVVNQNGERFCNETESNPAIREVALEEQPGAVQYDIFTEEILEDLRALNAAYFYDAYFVDETMPGYHVVSTASSLEELAEKIGVPAEKLCKTVEEYNAAVEAGGSDEFGRLYDGTVNSYNLATNKIEGTKYYAVRLQSLCVMTLGGVMTNENMQVLDTEGHVIPGLYAAGEVVGGIWGKFVSGGTGVMGAIVFGKVAAEHAMLNTPAKGYEVKTSPELLDASLFPTKTSNKERFDMSTELVDGEYCSTVDGQKGAMTVRVVITGGKIAEVEVLEHKESKNVAADALEQIPKAIVAANSPSVDAVSGATGTSERIMEAVVKCLEEAAK